MQADAVPLEAVQDAILVGSCRKYVSWLNGGPDQAIGTLSYFVPIVAEIRQQPISVDYRDYLRAKTESYGELWQEGRRLPGPPAGG
jgi:hypothetical protein